MVTGSKSVHIHEIRQTVVIQSLIGKVFGTGEVERLMEENRLLYERHSRLSEYLRRKTNQLLVLLGTLPFRADELQDERLLELDPIGTIADAFVQILEHEKSLKERLKISHDEIRAILSSVETGILVLDAEMKVLLCNRRVVDMFGTSEQALLGRTCRDVICSEGVKGIDCTFDRILETKRLCHQHDWQQNNCHFEVTGVPIKNRLGDITHVVLAYTDITERVETERRLREREQMYFEVFESLEDMIQCVLPNGSLLFANRSWKAALGYSDDERDGLKVWNVIAPAHRSACMETFRQVLEGKVMDDVQTCFFSKDGREIEVSGRISCSFSNGKPLATLGIFRPIERQNHGAGQDA